MQPYLAFDQLVVEFDQCLIDGVDLGAEQRVVGVACLVLHLSVFVEGLFVHAFDFFQE